MSTWTTDDSAELYGIRRWGNGYFDVSAQGELTVRVPTADGSVQVALAEILDGVRQRDLRLPLLLRIENLLDAQITRLNEAFRDAIAEHDYPGSYRGVFPIKVNQQRQVIEEITRFGAPYRHGLEAGSKAELMIALANLPADGSLIICNGYKDRKFIDLGLRARQLGFHCIFVIETPAELPVILARSRALGIEPLLGVRVKLSTTVGGHWNLTSGERSIFGLSISQLIEVVDQLREAEMLKTLRLLHCHLGSQIPQLDDIRSAAAEACRFYQELMNEGAAMEMIDFGGGLAVDYLGTGSSDSQSRDYSLADYAAALVETVMTNLAGLDRPPTIITESGRETVAYYSLLLFNIFDVTRFDPATEGLIPGPEAHPLLRKMASRLERIGAETPQQNYREIVACRDRLHELFTAGQLSLRDRARAQELLLAAGRRLLRQSPGQQLPADLQTLREDLAAIYYGNLSVFQSLPDHWAIGQLFPVAPIRRLAEKPQCHAVIADITCDSDGRISRFIADRGTRATLPLHELAPGEDYVLATFLVGAYQETLGDLHNLFGDTDIASVRIEADGGFVITREDRGDSVADLLGYVQYDARELKARFRATAEQAVRENRINLPQRQEILACFNAGLDGYSYFET
ncbi:arginine decarboxylase [Geothermobacter hydrogeniphilus]|uniref:Arginine decarboxylase n=1 Tax=Geothermobacter hydrogeniphilus TaxID=1969733 RepID=A0A2K2H8T0_9BACT|nr:biosynthetic arginine decarboxylase [Geothermobacter hydrogeniphilus]PNU19726.1 arginine decarboxylase [Geothermobacter hydrogeniphilus]